MSVVGLVRRGTTVGSVLLLVVVTGCGASRSDYEPLQTQNQQLQTHLQRLQTRDQQLTQQVAAQTEQITRLQGAIKYTANSDLLFSSGSWKISPRGQETMAKMASQLTPSQQSHLFVNGYTDNAPIGPGLRAQGVTTIEELSQKRADAVIPSAAIAGQSESLRDIWPCGPYQGGGWPVLASLAGNRPVLWPQAAQAWELIDLGHTRPFPGPW
jgi:chemotaxis protein MotB